MSIHRPAPSAQIIAVATVMALIVTTLVIALASIAVGAYPNPEVEEQGGTQTAPTPATTSTEAPHRQAGPSSSSSTSALLDPSVGRGAASQACAVSPRSPRCRLEGGGSMSITRGGHALRPATDGPETLLHSEWDETGPADMPGRAPGRGGWVGEQGPSVA